MFTLFKIMSQIEKTKCLIIGSGPAGYTAAIYAARADMSPVLYQGLQPGGQLTTTNEVENFPGYKDGVTGPEMMVELEAQAKRFETDVRPGFINKVDFSGSVHKCWADNGQEIHAETVVIATGASAKYLGLDSEKSYLGKGVSACATCDGFFYRDQEIVVVGGGNTAVEEALYLANIASKVTLIHRRDTLRAEAILIERIKQKEKEGKVEFVWNHTLDEVLGDGNKVEGVKVKNVQSNEIKTIDCSGAFIAIGHKPNTDIFRDSLEMDDTGYLKIQSGIKGNATQCSKEGVFAAGDVSDSIYRQAITSAGAGCMAALDAEKFLDN